MKYNELQVKSHRQIKRVGRGISAGQGKTAGRGTKGQNSRAGSSKKPGFAGGSNPLMQQLPKLPGFRSYKTKPENVYTDQLNSLKATTITAETLAEDGLLSSPHVAAKLLYRGEVTRKVNVSLFSASKKAIDAIQTAGGSFAKVDRIPRQAKTKENS
jgi:large subunit ribosomal protein L15